MKMVYWERYRELSSYTVEILDISLIFFMIHNSIMTVKLHIQKINKIKMAISLNRLLHHKTCQLYIVMMFHWPFQFGQRCQSCKQMIKSSLAEQESFLPSYKIIILGMAAAGKTKLLTRYRYGTYSDAGTITAMVDCTLVVRPNGRFGYFDTAGQEKYRSILSMYFKGSDAALLIYAVDNPSSLTELSYYQEQLKNHAPNCRIFLIATKCDLPRKVSKEMVKETFGGVRHFQTSAKMNLHVDQAFGEIEKELLSSPKKPIQTFGIAINRTSVFKQREKCCLSQ